VAHPAVRPPTPTAPGRPPTPGDPVAGRLAREAATLAAAVATARGRLAATVWSSTAAAEARAATGRALDRVQACADALRRAA
jgi:hypothetical protein